MNRPHMSVSQLIHLRDETAAPTVTITTHEMSGGTTVHRIQIISNRWPLVDLTLFSDFDAPLLVTQIDERPGGEAE